MVFGPSLAQDVPGLGFGTPVADGPGGAVPLTLGSIPVLDPRVREVISLLPTPPSVSLFWYS